MAVVSSKKRKINELVEQVDSQHELDPMVTEILLDIADQFVSNTIVYSCMLAKLRGDNTLQLKDVNMCLEKNWNIRVPGYVVQEPAAKEAKKNPLVDRDRKMEPHVQVCQVDSVA
eukprot:TRINITY_DN24479_c0_g1_i3.p1 TRINITY_DN24479_c0_g1~~TRINITY_DN24479_c0_g1_i3.p1  ORF type:complete len:115 (+),score=3.28 TRINITY_DN24479_c0_g1_i3:54-398(+)